MSAVNDCVLVAYSDAHFLRCLVQGSVNILGGSVNGGIPQSLASQQYTEILTGTIIYKKKLKIICAWFWSEAQSFSVNGVEGASGLQ